MPIRKRLGSANLTRAKKLIGTAKKKNITSFERDQIKKEASNKLTLFLEKQKEIPPEAAGKLAKEIVDLTAGGVLFNDAFRASLKKYAKKRNP